MMGLKKCRSHNDSTQAVPKHVEDCVPIVFILQFIEGWFHKLNFASDTV